MGRKKIGMAVPVALDDELRRDVKRVAELRKEADSTVMRSAIRAGLPIVEAGGSGDYIQLDGELSADVGKVAAEQGRSRQRVLLEAIRIGLAPVQARWVASHPESGPEIPEEEAHRLWSHDPDSLPILKDLRRHRNNAAWLENFLAQMRLFPGVQEVQERVERVVVWAQRKGRPWPVSPGRGVAIPMKDFEAYEREMLAESPHEPDSPPAPATPAKRNRTK